jgi:hypothetical protein
MVAGLHYLIDTNTWSETATPAPNRGVIRRIRQNLTLDDWSA